MKQYAALKNFTMVVGQELVVLYDILETILEILSLFKGDPLQITFKLVQTYCACSKLFLGDIEGFLRQFVYKEGCETQRFIFYKMVKFFFLIYKLGGQPQLGNCQPGGPPKLSFVLLLLDFFFLNQGNQNFCNAFLAFFKSYF